MKKIFTAGLTVVLILGLIGVIFKLIAVDFLANIFRPLILLFTSELMVIPLSLVFMVVIIFLIGLSAVHIKFQGIVIRFLERMLPKGKHGALVEKSVGVYDLAIVIKEIKLQRLLGTTQTLYLLFYPSIPVVWTSGLPVGLVSEDKLILIESSDREIFATIATYGKNAPGIFKEIAKNKSTD